VSDQQIAGHSFYEFHWDPTTLKAARFFSMTRSLVIHLEQYISNNSQPLEESNSSTRPPTALSFPQK
jgi:hypothetical protein